MHKVTLLFILLIALSQNSKALDRSIQLTPDIKAYTGNLQWQRIGSELREYLKAISMTGDAESREESLVLLSALRYQPFSIDIIDSSLFQVVLDNGEIYPCRYAEQMIHFIRKTLALSCITVTRTRSGSFSIAVSMMTSSPDSCRAFLRYSPVQSGNWLSTTELKMIPEYNSSLNLLTLKSEISIQPGTDVEFAFRIINESYDYWDNNEGRNYRI
ncbi:MAG: carbohydrate-binding protein [Candidatus Wallbacteria bacterium]|nr:carbohydrate-binding protein [Candidatus Wallbacteria bacterium]